MSFEIWDADGETESTFITKLAVDQSHFVVRKKIDFSDWEELRKIHLNSRTMGFSGVLIYEKDKKHNCFFLPANNYSVNAVLLYVETGNMTPSGVHSVTFGLPDKTALVPIAKISAIESELDLSEIAEFTKSNTVERFGPVRTVKPELVYELHFDNVRKAPRRKCGMILSNVKIHKKINKGPEQANTLDDLQKFLN